MYFQPLPTIYYLPYNPLEHQQYLQSQGNPAKFLELLVNASATLSNSQVEIIRELTTERTIQRQLKAENAALRQDEESSYHIQKRSYSKRKEGLVKYFQCRVEGCQRRYSSVIALNNHQRLKHDVRKRGKKQQ